MAQELQMWSTAPPVLGTHIQVEEVYKLDPLKLTEVGGLSTWVWGEKAHRSQEGCQTSCENQNPEGQTSAGSK